MLRAWFDKLTEQITKGLVRGDYASYRKSFRLPVTIEPRDGTSYVLTTETELKSDFDLYRSAIELHKVTDFMRDVIAITEIDDDWIEVTVRSHVLGHNGLVVDPFTTQFILRYVGDRWRIAGIRSALGHINWTLGRAEIDDSGKFTDPKADD